MVIIADDIAETISMRIINNSYLEGLCPIFELREIFNIKLFRPFYVLQKIKFYNLIQIKKLTLLMIHQILMINILDQELEKFLIMK